MFLGGGAATSGSTLTKGRETREAGFDRMPPISDSRSRMPFIPSERLARTPGSAAAAATVRWELPETETVAVGGSAVVRRGPSHAGELSPSGASRVGINPPSLNVPRRLLAEDEAPDGDGLPL